MKSEELRMERKVSTRIPTKDGGFMVHLYHSSRHPEKEHMAFVYGDISHGENIMTRIHSECFTGEVIGSLRCDCREQLHTAQERIAREGAGVVVYLRQEGRGIGLLEKLRAYNLQDQGYDTVDANLQLGHPADARTYDEASLILKDLGVKTVRLLTNNSEKVEKLQREGIVVSERLEMVPTMVTPETYAYLATKVERMNHTLDLRSISNTHTPVSHSDSEASSALSAAVSSPPSPSSSPIPFSSSKSTPSLIAVKKPLDKLAPKHTSSSLPSLMTATAARPEPVRGYRMLPNYFF